MKRITLLVIAVLMICGTLMAGGRSARTQAPDATATSGIPQGVRDAITNVDDSEDIIIGIGSADRHDEAMDYARAELTRVTLSIIANIIQDFEVMGDIDSVEAMMGLENLSAALDQIVLEDASIGYQGVHGGTHWVVLYLMKYDVIGLVASTMPTEVYSRFRYGW